MSVVVWDGKMLAADRQATCGDVKTAVTKIFRVEAKDCIRSMEPERVSIIAFDGRYEEGLRLLAWWKQRETNETWPAFQKNTDFTQLIIASGTRCYEMESLPIQQLAICEFMIYVMRTRAFELSNPIANQQSGRYRNGDMNVSLSATDLVKYQTL